MEERIRNYVLAIPESVANFVRHTQNMNVNTAEEYYRRLNIFDRFVLEEYKYNTDGLIKEIKEGKQDVYDVLSNYVSSLLYRKNGTRISPTTLRLRVITVKNMLEFNDVDISSRKLKFKVRLPRQIRRNREALSKEDIVEILNACSDMRLKSYIMFLASTGTRVVEALSIRWADCDLTTIPPKAFIRGEFTKTKTDRIVFLTDEMKRQLHRWSEHNYRTRRVSYFDKRKSKTVTQYRIPSKKESDLVFAVNKPDARPANIYTFLVRLFEKTLDVIGRGEREDHKRRRKITLHSLRRFTKSTISDLGYQDYSEWFIGHSGSTYWQKKESEKAELFKKIEPYLTLLDITSLKAKGADIETKLTEKEKEIQLLRQRDTINTDTISNLSDQVMKLMVEVQEMKNPSQF